MTQPTEIVKIEETKPVPEYGLDRKPEEILSEAQRAAANLKDVIEKKAKKVTINGETYLEFEDWQTLGRFYGVTAKVMRTHYIDLGGVKGFEARATAYYLRTGQEISAAEAMCLNDEPQWKDKPLFQVRSMAQTRACAKALRNVLSWVVVLAGYRPTPAEEMDGVIPKEESRGEGVAPSVPDCPKGHGKMRLFPAGKAKKTGREYPAFWACSNRECKESIRDADWQKQQIVEAIRQVAADPVAAEVRSRSGQQSLREYLDSLIIQDLTQQDLALILRHASEALQNARHNDLGPEANA